MFSRRNFARITITAAGGLVALAAAPRLIRTAAADQEERPSNKEFEIMKSESGWRQSLTADQFYVLRKHGTERAGTSPLNKNYAPGTYVCAGCGLPLYLSETKFDSHTGWPSFWKPIDDAVGTSSDTTYLMVRTEVHCRRCGGHLGHVFDDGPKPTGLRYCMNGVALKFIPRAEPTPPTQAQ